MKNMLIVLTVGLVLIAGVAYGGAKRVVDYPANIVGVDSVILANHDSAFATQIAIPLVNKDGSHTYDGLFGYFYAPNIAAYIDTQITQSGKVDTCILLITAGYGMRRDTILREVLLPPDTALFEWWNGFDYSQTGDVQYIEKDSSADSAWVGGVYVPTDKPSRRTLYYDWLYIDVYESDTAGTGDTGIWLNQYRVRFIEDGE